MFILLFKSLADIYVIHVRQASSRYFHNLANHLTFEDVPLNNFHLNYLSSDPEILLFGQTIMYTPTHTTLVLNSHTNNSTLHGRAFTQPHNCFFSISQKL